MYAHNKAFCHIGINKVHKPNSTIQPVANMQDESSFHRTIDTFNIMYGDIRTDIRTINDKCIRYRDPTA